MRRSALEQGVPDEDIVLDYAGRRTGQSTRDTCYRAGTIFVVEHAVLVTQAFHLDRALYTCDKLGIDAVGLAADRRSPQGSRREYYSIRLWWWRELAAVTAAWLDLNIRHPLPVLGDELPIS